MSLFKKRTTRIEARQFTVENWEELAAWCNGVVGREEGGTPYIMVNGMGRLIKAVPGDWIMRGADGSFYPAKPEWLSTQKLLKLSK